MKAKILVEIEWFMPDQLRESPIHGDIKTPEDVVIFADNLIANSIGMLCDTGEFNNYGAQVEGFSTTFVEIDPSSISEE